MQSVTRCATNAAEAVQFDAAYRGLALSDLPCKLAANVQIARPRENRVDRRCDRADTFLLAVERVGELACDHDADAFRLKFVPYASQLAGEVVVPPQWH